MFTRGELKADKGKKKTKDPTTGALELSCEGHSACLFAFISFHVPTFSSFSPSLFLFLFVGGLMEIYGILIRSGLSPRFGPALGSVGDVDTLGWRFDASDWGFNKVDNPCLLLCLMLRFVSFRLVVCPHEGILPGGRRRRRLALAMAGLVPRFLPPLFLSSSMPGSAPVSSCLAWSGCLPCDVFSHACAARASCIHSLPAQHSRVCIGGHLWQIV